MVARDIGLRRMKETVFTSAESNQAWKECVKLVGRQSQMYWVERGFLQQCIVVERWVESVGDWWAVGEMCAINHVL